MTAQLMVMGLMIDWLVLDFCDFVIGQIVFFQLVIENPNDN